MHLANLAIVLGPNLLRPRHESMLRMVEDSRHINGIIQSILEEYEFLVLVCLNFILSKTLKTNFIL